MSEPLLSKIDIDPVTLFDASPNPYLILDRSLHIVGANKAYLKTTKRELADIVGRLAWEAFPTDSQTLKQTIASVEQAIYTKQPDTIALLRYDIPRPEAEGGGFEKRYWSTTHTPILNEEGEVVFVMQHPIDVTELERLRQAMPAANQEQHSINLSPAVSGLFSHAQSVYQANLSLMAESDRLNTVFAQAPSPICVLAGKDHVYDIVNEAYYQLAGRRDLIGKSLLEVWPELAAQGVGAQLDEVFNTGRPYVGRGRKLEVKSNPNLPPTTLYQDVLYQPLLGRDGRVTAVFCQLNDVTDAYLAQAQLHERKERLKQEMRRQAFLLALADRLRPLSDPQEITAAASELLGKELGAARVGYIEVDELGENITIRPGWNSGELPSTDGAHFKLDHFGPVAANAIRNGKVIMIEDVTTDERSAAYADLYTANGVRSLLAIPLMKEGRLRAMLGVRNSRIHHWTDEEVILAEEMVDRTWLALERAYAEEKRIRAEEALRKIAKRQELLIDTADLLRKTSDPNTICRKSSEILGQHFQVSRVLFGEYHLADKTITCHSNYTDGTVSEVNGTFPAVGFGTANLVSLENGITWVGDDLSTDPRTSGPETWQTWEALHIYSAVGVPLSRQGEMVACLFISHNKPRHWSREEVRLIEDVAERIWNALERLRSEEALKQADRHKDEFLAMLAHELRNPLAPIGSAAEYLYSAQLNEQQVRQASEVIVRQVKHMTNLVNDLLDVARVTKGLVKLNNRPLDIRHIMGEAVEQATPLIQARGQHLMLQHAKDPMIVMGDRERLIQVVTNLINNAVKYTHEGGNIQVQATVRDERVLLEIIDDGIGMAPEVISHVFDLFAQAEVSLDRSAGGLGIGLSLVKTLVEFHGGTVSCQSDGMGKGSTFSILLPRIVEAAQAMPQPEETRSQEPKQPLRILIVDDHVQAAKMLAMLLEALGHEVLIEHSSRRALERATLERPDVCLLDIGMPEMDGHELAQCLRAQTPTAKSVLIAVTGYGHERDREKASAAGFDHHLVKPVDTVKLTSILAEIAKA